MHCLDTIGAWCCLLVCVVCTAGPWQCMYLQAMTVFGLSGLQAKLREEKNPVVRVTPIAGSIAPYSTAQLTVIFKPLATAQAVGFKVQPLTAQQQEQNFEYLLQVSSNHT